MFKNRLRKQKLSKTLCANRNQFYKLAYSWSGDAMLADDLVQEAMQKALLSFDSLKDDSKLNAWTCRIMLNCYREWIRRRKENVDIDELDIADDSNPQQVLSSTNTQNMVRQCINKLAEKHRHVITLVDLMELSYEEVAMALEIPIGTVMSRLCRGRSQLKAFLESATNEHKPLKNTSLRRVK